MKTRMPFLFKFAFEVIAADRGCSVAAVYREAIAEHLERIERTKWEREKAAWEREFGNQ